MQPQCTSTSNPMIVRKCCNEKELEDQLAMCRSTLMETENDVMEVQKDLLEAQEDLSKTKEMLAATMEELSEAKRELRKCCTSDSSD